MRPSCLHPFVQSRLVAIVLASPALVACSDDASSLGGGQTSGASSTQSGETSDNSDASGSEATTGSTSTTTTANTTGAVAESGETSSGEDTTGDGFPTDTRIAFIRLVGGGYQAFVAEADGSGEVQITDGNMSTTDVSWSPDGQRLAVSDGSVLRVMDDDGANSFDVMLPEQGVQVLRSSWAPDNETLVFDASNDIYTTVAEPGSTPTPLLTLNANDGPEWSPDGTSIVYVRGVGMPAFEQDGVYLIDADGSNERILTPVELGLATSATWLRDGETILFDDSDDDGVSQIYAIQSDGSDRRALTDEASNVSTPRRCAEHDCAFVLQFGEGIDNGAYRLDTVTGELALAVPDAVLVASVP